MAKNTVSGGNPVEPIHGFDGATTGEIIQSSVLVKEGTDTPLASHATRGLVVDNSGSGILSSRFTVAVAGSTANLPGTACKEVFVVALPSNTQRISVGGSTADAATSTFNGVPLDPGQGISFAVNNTNLIFVDVLGDGHGVSFTYVS